MLALTIAQGAIGQKRSYTEDDFTIVAFGLPGTLTVQQGNSFSIELEGDEDDLDRIEVEVKNGTLVFSTKNGSWRRMGDINGTVVLPMIEGLTVSGSGSIKTRGRLSVDDISLVVSGSGDLVSNIKAGAVSMVVSGSGEMTVEGDCGKTRVVISGSGDVDAGDLQGKDCSATISGSGEAKVHVDGNLKATISGSGNVYYRGNPSDVNARVSGSGKVARM